MTETIQNDLDIDALDWQKSSDGLLPVVVQDTHTLKVLMLGYMNEAALDKTLAGGKVTFFSRSKQRLWTKGETSGNFLSLTSIRQDCDNDTILVRAVPQGPTCHNGTETCFAGQDGHPVLFLSELAAVIESRKGDKPEDSYTASLFAKGAAKIAQKVGEEGVEVALAHMKKDREEILNESADLLYHLSVLLSDAGLSLDQACEVLEKRHKK